MENSEDLFDEIGNEIFAIKLGLQSISREPELSGNATLEELIASSTKLTQLFSQLRTNMDT